MSSEALMDQLVVYFAEMERHRAEDVAQALSRLSAREVQLFREAAVMGYVRGVMAGKVGNEQIPKDIAIVGLVVSCCLSIPELYRTISAYVQDESDTPEVTHER